MGMPATTDYQSVSVIVPLYNEEESLETLYDEIAVALSASGLNWDVVFINDGSTDDSASILNGLVKRSDRATVIELRRNFGKAAALDAGMNAARGEIIVTMDADLQDDPAEIPRFIEQISAGYEVVSGWKKHRKDPVDKTLPSLIFNWVVSRISGLKLNDFNCGFKAYTADAVRGLRLYGELHRFVPVLLHWQGFRVSEITVNHRPRQFGRSKYGLTRIVKGLLDLMTVVLNTRFAARPMHVFGSLGLLMSAIGFVCLSYLTIIWFFEGGPIGTRPLLLFGVLLVLAGLQAFAIGLLGEFIQARSEFKSYSVRCVRSADGDEKQ